MDNSETYIKMSEKAEEIQVNWNPKSGDFVWRKYTLFGDEIDSKIWSEQQRTDITILIQKSSVGTYWSATDKDSNERIFDSDEDITKCTCLWLPRQDQLQAILVKHRHPAIDEERYCAYYLYLDFYDWLPRHGSILENKGRLNCNSMEQLWLAFVMKEKYSKVWNGDEWTSG